MSSSQPYGAKKPRLARGFLGHVIERKLREPTTLLGGTQISEPTKLLPFLYFYSNIALEMCPHCPPAQNPSLIRPFLEQGILSVFMIGEFSKSPKKFQQLAIEFPELVVGPESYLSYRYFSLNPDHPNRIHHENHYCAACLNEKLAPHDTKVATLPARLKDQMRRTRSGIMQIQKPSANDFAKLYIETLKHPTAQSIEELRTVTSMANYVASSQALGAAPQLQSEFLAKSTLFLKSLRINFPTDLPIDEALAFIQDFRGSLYRELPLSESAIVRRVIHINEELDNLLSSKRYKISTFSSRFTGNITSLAIQILTNRSVSWEGGLIKPSSLAPGPSKTRAKLLAKLMGISPTAFHVWQIRQAKNKHPAA